MSDEPETKPTPIVVPEPERKFNAAVSPKIGKDKLDKLVQKVKGKMGNIVPSTISTAVALIMSEIRSVVILNNQEKKDLVVYLLYKLTHDLPMEQWNEIDLLIRTVVPSMIDAFVDVAKLKIPVIKMTKVAKAMSRFSLKSLAIWTSCLSTKVKKDIKPRSTPGVKKSK